MKISDMYGAAYDWAIVQVADWLNEKFGSNYDYKDWRVLEPFAIVNQFEFDENGDIVNIPEVVSASKRVITSSKLLKIKRRSGKIDTYEYKRADGQGDVYEPIDAGNWWSSYIVTPEGKLLSWTTRGEYYPSNNEFWIEDDTVEGCGSINASSYIDNGAFGAIGEVYTREELKAMFNNLCAEGDPICNTYDSFESWFEDSLDSGLIQDSDLDANTVHRLAPYNYDAIISALDAAGCWYKYDEDFDRILVLPAALYALDAAGIEYTEV